MTKVQVDNLEIKVAVIQNDITTLKDDTKAVKGMLRWFIGLSIVIIAVVLTNTFINSGDTKTMKSIIEHNSLVIGEIAQQGIEKGWYNPSSEAYRGAVKKGDI